MIIPQPYANEISQATNEIDFYVRSVKKPVSLT